MDNKLFRIIAALIAVVLLNSFFAVNYAPASFVFAADKGGTAVTVTPFQTSSRYDLGIDANDVRIGWRISSSSRGFLQKAYRVEVIDAGSNAAVWDSGWVESDAQTGIRPEGLRPETVYKYRVNVRSADGSESGFSETKTLETAPASVDGAWLNSPKLLRKSFELEQDRNNIDRARCYFSSAGWMELRLNGNKVGDLVLSPKKSVRDLVTYYNTYDVTDMLLNGENVIGAYVSAGADGGHSLAGMLRIYYKDGSTQTVATGKDWRSCSSSEITRENYQNGEDIDASKITGWDRPGFEEDKKWVGVQGSAISVSDGKLVLGSNAGTFTSYENFSGDYEIETVLTVKQGVAALEFGAKSGVSSPCMWQVTGSGLRIHYPGWTKIETPSAKISSGKPVTMKLEIRGNVVTTYIDGNKLRSDTMGSGETAGTLGIRSALNEASEFDRITVTQNGEVIWEDNFDTMDSSKWNYPASPVLRPAVSGTKIIEEFKPVSVAKVGKAYILDFGQNMSGFVRLTTKGEKGTKYLIEYSELLDKDGDIFANTTAHYPKSTYKLSGGDDTFEPRFFYTGFRYIKVTTPGGNEPDPNDFTACFVSDDLDQTGFFESDNDRLNSVFHMFLMSARSNLVGNYTDCPQREKNGWTGDASVSKEADALVLGDWSTADAFLDTMLMNIKKDGRPQIVVPTVSTGESGAQFDITWASAYFEFPYQLYRYTGDTVYIRRSYEALQKVFAYARSLGKGELIVTHNVYGDWVGYDNQNGKIDRGFLSAIYLYYCGSLLSEMMDVINEPHGELTSYLNDMKAALIERYYKNGFYSTEAQTSNALPLALGLATEDQRSAVLKALLDASEKNGRTLRTGVLGTKAVYDALSDANAHKLLLDMTVSHEKCSFGYMLDNGATTLWEYWDRACETFNSNHPQGLAYFDSQNHVMLGGGAATWMLEGLGGIRNAAPGFRTVSLRPGIESGLSEVSSHIDTLPGTYVSNWKYVKGILTWDVEIPAGCTATVTIPLKGLRNLTESGVNILKRDGEGISYAGTGEDGSLIYKVGSGQYHFVAGGEPVSDGNGHSSGGNATWLRPLFFVLAGVAVLSAAAAAVVIVRNRKKSK